MIEQHFLGSVLAERAQYYDVADLPEIAFTNLHLGIVWRMIKRRQGSTAPALLWQDLQDDVAGREALASLKWSIHDIQDLITLGITAGSASALADELRQAYARQQLTQLSREAFGSEHSVQEAARILAARATLIADNLERHQISNNLILGSEEMLAHLEWSIANPGKIRGIRTGLGAAAGMASRYDKMMQGLQGGELNVFAGNTNEGKSAVVCALAMGMAKTPRDDTGRASAVVFVSLEMKEAELSRRWASMLSGVPVGDAEFVRKCNGLPRIKAAQAEIRQLSEESRLSVIRDGYHLDRVVSAARGLRQKDKCDALIIDYVGLMHTSDRNASAYVQQAVISQRLKELAQELDIPITIVAQTNRSTNDNTAGKPGLSNIADCYDLIRNADNVQFFWRPERYLAGEAINVWKNICVVLSPKARHRMADRSLYLEGNLSLNQFTDVTLEREAALIKEQGNLGRR